eukprot:gb/GFBE01042589.1/.p1 GENE.gb/GFBE01042589.1/~~gb/GFBE01042589.1/.p1  ORF type:complete len:415 (+),score=76.18 gb/GFBE01042589.1/:1-1245(+)
MGLSRPLASPEDVLVVDAECSRGYAAEFIAPPWLRPSRLRCRPGIGRGRSNADKQPQPEAEEQQDDQQPEAPEELPREEYLAKLRHELEDCFSDSKLCTDQFLHASLSKALPSGWVSCAWLVGLQQLKDLQPTPELILEALKDSHLESKSEGGSYVRRRQPLPPVLRKDAERSPLHDTAKLNDMMKAVLRDPFGTLNRLQDQWRVWQTLRLEEVGNNTVKFFEKASLKDSSPTVIAVGYERILYGDDGPYVELSKSQICWDAWPHKHDKKNYGNSYYDEHFTGRSYATWRERWQRWEDKPCKGLLMLYAQRNAVSNRPWAPSAAARPHAWRDHGYADYRPGYYYVSADGDLIATETSLTLPAKAMDLRVEPRYSVKTQAARHPGQAGNKEYQICWNFKAGKCQQGRLCKWRHYP